MIVTFSVGNPNEYVSVHRKKLYPLFHLHWCPLQRFFICLLQACSLLQHLLNTSNSQTKSIYLCFHPRVNSLPLKKSDRIWVEGGLTLVCSCPTMPVIMNHEVVENKQCTPPTLLCEQCTKYVPRTPHIQLDMFWVGAINICLIVVHSVDES